MRGIEAAQQCHLARELIAQDDPKGGHGVRGRAWRGAPGDAPAHRFEQCFTCSQSLAHFLRQVKGRPHRAQSFVGRSAFARIFAMAGV